MSTALRAVPFVTANVGTGSPAEAAAFATHFDRRGFPVTFWEVGNEVYFQGILGPVSWGRRLISTPRR